VTVHFHVHYVGDGLDKNLVVYDIYVVYMMCMMLCSCRLAFMKFVKIVAGERGGGMNLYHLVPVCVHIHKLIYV
jgi:hypothetical protein